MVYQNSFTFPLLMLKHDSSFLVVCSGAQEIFKLLPHTFVDPSRLSELVTIQYYIWFMLGVLNIDSVR